MLGIPTRIEIGPKDIEKNQVVVVRRDNREKIVVSMDEIAVKLREILETIQSDMYDRAKDFLDTHIYTATSLDEMKEEFTKKRGFVKACWCGAVSYTHLDVYKRQCICCWERTPEVSGVPHISRRF